MTLNVAKEFLEFPAELKNTIYVVYIDKKIWGYSENLDSAKKWSEEVSKTIRDSIQKKKPHYKIEIITNENGYTINCISPGYLRNGYKSHVISYEPIFKIKNIVKLKRTESCNIIIHDYKVETPQFEELEASIVFETETEGTETDLITKFENFQIQPNNLYLNSIVTKKNSRRYKRSRLNEYYSANEDDYCPPSPPLPPLLIKNVKQLETKYYRDKKNN